MKIRILSQFDVRQLLDMGECIEAMATALSAVTQGEATLPLRQAIWLPKRIGILGLMPAALHSPPRTGLKAVTVFPGNHGTELDAHQGAVLLFEAERGRLLAIVDASSITALRTAAVSGLATRALSNPDAPDLALLGSGVQAASHLEAMLRVRPIRRVRVWSRHQDHAAAFAETQSNRWQVPVDACGTAREAVADADLICTVTSAREPVLQGSWITRGAHVNAVGSSLPNNRELDAEAVRQARLFVDRRESTLNEAGDFLLAKAEGLVTDDHIQGELGEVLLKRVTGRVSAGEITLFKSLGLAVEDLAAADLVYRKSLQTGAGVEVELGGESRH